MRVVLGDGGGGGGRGKLSMACFGGVGVPLSPPLSISISGSDLMRLDDAPYIVFLDVSDGTDDFLPERSPDDSAPLEDDSAPLMPSIEMTSWLLVDPGLFTPLELDKPTR